MNWKPWHLLIKPSTLEFTRQARRLHDFNLWNWLHGYVYGRWLYLYIGTGIGEHPLAKVLGPSVHWITHLLPKLNPGDPHSLSMADTYHGKVIPLESARQLVSVQEDVRLENLEQVIPYPKARDLILQNPDHIVVLDCPCRAARPAPCLPLDVCLVVGEPFASFILEHQPRHSRWITSKEAIDILKAEDARGHAHHAFFKDAMLDRFYAICNCCSCCCGAIQSHRNGNPMLASSGYTAWVNEELCLGCNTCTEYCQFSALSLGAELVAQVDWDACMGCGVCVDKCPNEALSLQRAPEKGTPLEIQILMEQALT
jgi:Pyruvate/2-oxoacid:ferredoxin oxidoreductase delta subunit